MTTCRHPADNHENSSMLLTKCPDCGEECSETQIGEDRLCYDEWCPLHAVVKVVERIARAYIVPEGLRSADETITLPVEIHNVLGGPWWACYEDGDVEYSSLFELARDHEVIITHDDLISWHFYTYFRDVEVESL